jgi:hypothetical protein
MREGKINSYSLLIVGISLRLVAEPLGCGPPPITYMSLSIATEAGP